MCGIVGFFTDDSKFAKRTALFNQLLFMDTLRGWDSTGVHLVKPSGEEIQYKRGLDAPTFLQTKGYENLIARNLDTSNIAIGHNRAATRGSINDTNAHPFTRKHVSLVHNGYIANSNYLRSNSPNFDVDSEAAAYALSEFGEKEGLETLLGDYALVWYNNQDSTLNLARNDGRPLVYCHIQQHNTLLFGSEMPILWAALERSGLGVKEDKFFELKEGVHYKFQRPATFEERPFTIKKPTPVGNVSYHNFRSGRWGSGSATSTGDSPPSGGTERFFTSGGNGLSPNAVRQAERALYYAGSIGTKQREIEGWPKNRNKALKAAGYLQKFAILLCENLYVHIAGWQSYGKNQQKGVVKATYKIGERVVPVEIPNRTEQDFNKLQEDTKGALKIIVTNFRNGSIIGSPVGSTVLTKTEPQSTEDPVTVPGPGGSKISIGHWAALTQHGCGACDSDINPNEAADVSWYGDSPVCGRCSVDPEILEAVGLIDPSKRVLQ